MISITDQQDFVEIKWFKADCKTKTGRLICLFKIPLKGGPFFLYMLPTGFSLFSGLFKIVILSALYQINHRLQ